MSTMTPDSLMALPEPDQQAFRAWLDSLGHPAIDVTKVDRNGTTVTVHTIDVDATRRTSRIVTRQHHHTSTPPVWKP